MLNFRKIAATLMAVTAVAVVATAVNPVAAQGGNGKVAGPLDNEAKALNASGATFPLPLYNSWNADYVGVTGVQINYAGGGSGRGIREITSSVVDFAGSDSFLSGSQEAAVKCGPVVHIASTMGGIVPLYNLPGFEGTLNLTANNIAKIYLGEIKGWNDPILIENNPGLASIAQPITPVFRSDGSGTTDNYSYFLSREDGRIRPGTTVNFLAGIGAAGNQGVADQVKNTPFSIGYVELAFAQGSTYAAVKNGAGKFVKADAASIAAAATGVSVPATTKIRLIYASANAKAYPITTFTWIITCTNQSDPAKALAIARYLWWITHDGQARATDLGYAPLPANVVKLNEANIKKINVGGTQALPFK